MQITLCDTLAGVGAGDWNRLVPVDQPFLRHEFLNALEHTGCTTARTGWVPQHLLAHDDDGALAGAVPMYLKSHSWGEYVFDWAWADAWRRNGLEYYPKLTVAVPFTPVSGPRLLVREGLEAGTGVEVRSALAGAAIEHARRLGVSSLHWLFTSEEDAALLARHGCLRRVGNQFHWRNQGFASFDDYLAAFNAQRRKKVRRERREVAEQGVTVEVLRGADIRPDHLLQMYRYYQSTARTHGAIAYLNRDLFLELGRRMAEQLVLVLARAGDSDIGGAIFLAGERSLYGRYWGARRYVRGLHFEVCYYTPIQYCIEHGLQRFEAGAQGEHKLMRGLMPTRTHSAHWIADARFATAVEDFLQVESEHMERYTEVLNAAAPWRRSG